MLDILVFSTNFQPSAARCPLKTFNNFETSFASFLTTGCIISVINRKKVSSLLIRLRRVSEIIHQSSQSLLVIRCCQISPRIFWNRPSVVGKLSISKRRLRNSTSSSRPDQFVLRIFNSSKIFLLVTSEIISTIY